MPTSTMTMTAVMVWTGRCALCRAANRGVCVMLRDGQATRTADDDAESVDGSPCRWHAPEPEVFGTFTTGVFAT